MKTGDLGDAVIPPDGTNWGEHGKDALYFLKYQSRITALILITQRTVDSLLYYDCLYIPARSGMPDWAFSTSDIKLELLD